jgi:RHS repeat-associated protein
VFVFTGTSFAARTYAGLSGNTNPSGQITFNLPNGIYWFGSLMDSTYCMEGSAVSCTVPACTSITLARADDGITTISNINYTYDGLYRLTEANYKDGNNNNNVIDDVQYTYDAVGNRLTQVAAVSGSNPVTTNYAYDNANRMTSAGGQTYSWDANGNLQTISSGGNAVKTFTFDDANRLTNLAITGGAAYSYTYNGAGDRVTQTVGSTTTQYLLDLNGSLSQVLSDGTNLYIPGLGQTSADGSNPQFYITDAQGSTRLMTDASGAIVGSPQSYDPFGSAQTSPTSSIGYTGEWKDASGLEYLRARYYDPATGRFISKDPLSGILSNPASMNGFNYADDNPIMGSDPTGKMCEIVDPIFTPLLCLAEIVTLYGPQITSVALPQMNFQSSWQPQGEGDFSLMMAGNIAGLENPLGEGETLGMELGNLAKSGVSEDVLAQIKPCLLESVNAGEIVVNENGKIVQMPASMIRFSQRSISPTTKGEPEVYLDQLTDEIANGNFRGSIEVTQKEDGYYYAINNRRLAAFKLLDIDVPVEIVPYSPRFNKYFSTVNNGLSIVVRGTGITIK